jgi:dephospho-CoA kinase
MKQNDLPVLGITGNSGSGKNTAGKILRGEGGYEIDADVLAREATRRGEPAYDEIVAVFGTNVLLNNKEIDRQKLGGIVFNDKGLRKHLESIVHRQVALRTHEIIAERNLLHDYDFIVINAPLLVEADMHLRCAKIWLICARKELKLSRMTARDGISEEMALKRLASQMTEESILKKLTGDMGARKATVIENNRDIGYLENQIKGALRRFLPKRQ